MEQYGNSSTFNLESVLIQNIKNSHYYIKKALDLETAHEIIDEIWETVDHVEPWLSGNARGPSSAFCLLYRLGEIKPSPPEIREILDHKDSPYIRAIGLLYLRYVCNPRDLWKWFQKYLCDNEQFTPSPKNVSSGKTVTIGAFARDILIDQYYFETIFPRVPKTISDEIKQNLRDMRLPCEPVGNGGQGGPDRRRSGDGRGRPVSVKEALAVGFGQRAPNRTGTREHRRADYGDRDFKRPGESSSRYRERRSDDHRRSSPHYDDRRVDRRDDRYAREREPGERYNERYRSRSRSRSRDRNDGSRRDHLL